MPKVNGTTWELLVSGAELETEAKIRAKEFCETTTLNSNLSSMLSDGWSVKKDGKNKTQLKREKTIGDAFEDRIWTIFFKMGFVTMNKTNSFHLAYSSEQLDLTKQLDVIAIDEETCVFVECKSASKEFAKQNWQKDIQEIGYLFPKLSLEVKKEYPNRKCKYIFATHNYVLGDMDRKRLEENDIYYFDDNVTLYYEKLVSFLGSAAKYQLLGSLFAGQKIDNMSNNIPAIKGFMGGTAYYSFLIKPSDLLKIGYVLHRTNANNDFENLLPSYQRLIKKDRLRKIREFVNNGGFFPNSIIVSIDNKNGGDLQFDCIAEDQNNDALIQTGILHLPQAYQSAYIIDGQHRLYGYSDSEYAENNSIPIVAFDNISKELQLKLFMDINENQKAVSKALRNILEIDVYYDSSDANLRKKALLGMIAKKLGEDTKSPLNGRVILGEDAQTTKCCITIDYIKAALEKTKFFNKYKKNNTLIEKGLFDNGNNDDTLKKIYPILLNYLSTIRELCQDEWEQYIAKNNAIVAVIRILDDIVDIVLNNNPSLVDDMEKLYADCESFILELATTLANLPLETRENIRRLRGEQAKEDAYRTIQMIMHESCSTFTNNNIEKYYTEKYINYANKAKEISYKLKSYLLDETKSVFNEEDWKMKHLSQDHLIDFSTRILKKNIANKSKGMPEIEDEWKELTFDDFIKIISFSTHWTDVYKTSFQKIGVSKTKIDILTILKSVSDTYEKAQSGKSVTLSEYNQIKEICGNIMEEK